MVLKGIGSYRWERDFEKAGVGEEIVLRTQNIKKKFGDVQALDGVDFELRENEFVSIIGPNGAGKTTLLNCINKFYEPDEGRIFVDETEITDYRPDQVAEEGVARTFQNIELFGELTTIDNLKIGSLLRTREETPWWHPIYPKIRDSRKHAEEIIDLLELEEVRDEVAGGLPYGIQKIIGLGRALAAKPKILLLDEPSAGLSLEEKEDMFRYLLEVKESTGISTVLVEHDLKLVMDLSDRLVVLHMGKEIAEGMPERVREQPEVTEAYLGSD